MKKPKKTKGKFAILLTKLLTDSRMDQSRVALLAGISSTYLTLLLQGERTRPRRNAVEGIGRALGFGPGSEMLRKLLEAAGHTPLEELEEPLTNSGESSDVSRFRRRGHRENAPADSDRNLTSPTGGTMTRRTEWEVKKFGTRLIFEFEPSGPDQFKVFVGFEKVADASCKTPRCKVRMTGDGSAIHQLELLESNRLVLLGMLPEGAVELSWVLIDPDDESRAEEYIFRERIPAR